MKNRALIATLIVVSFLAACAIHRPTNQERLAARQRLAASGMIVIGPNDKPDLKKLIDKEWRILEDTNPPQSGEMRVFYLNEITSNKEPGQRELDVHDADALRRVQGYLPTKRMTKDLYIHFRGTLLLSKSGKVGYLCAVFNGEKNLIWGIESIGGVFDSAHMVPKN